MIYTIVAILVGLWLLGVILRIGGGLINFLLVIAAIILVYRLVAGGRSGR